MATKSKLDTSCQQESGDAGKNDAIQMISLEKLHDFKDHPFKVENDMALFELMQSIEKEGVIVPALARPSKDGNGYELIAGHRRKTASNWAGLTEMPVIVRDLDDNQAIIAMVNSNLQREHIKQNMTSQKIRKHQRNQWVKSAIRQIYRILNQYMLLL